MQMSWRRGDFIQKNTFKRVSAGSQCSVIFRMSAIEALFVNILSNLIIPRHTASNMHFISKKIVKKQSQLLTLNVNPVLSINITPAIPIVRMVDRATVNPGLWSSPQIILVKIFHHLVYRITNFESWLRLPILAFCFKLRK